MTKQLPARPNLDHLRRQAKALLAQLKDGDAAAARAFAEHLPAARGKKPVALAAAFSTSTASSAARSAAASWTGSAMTHGS